ncbi:MAG: hypothetical protein JXB50_10735 [Spirochaetes bacterium]|nr:hypothetical protein [Spirochaetota bacterium]
MKKIHFRRKLLIFFLITEFIFVLNFYFIIYPFMGLSYQLIIKGMGPSFTFMIIMVTLTAFVLSRLSKNLDCLDINDIENNKIIITKADKRIRAIFISMNIILFPTFVSFGGFITLIADGLIRWSTIRALIVCGIILGPSVGLIQLIFVEYLIKDVKIYANIIEYEVKKSFFNFRRTFLLIFLLIGSLVIVFMMMISITHIEKIAGISNVAVKVNPDVQVEPVNGYFTKLLELAKNSTDEKVRAEAERLVSNWNNEAGKFLLLSFLSAFVAMSLFLLYTFIVGLNIASHLHRIISKLKNLVRLDGDLTQMIVKTRNDEIGEIQILFNQFIINLNNTFYKIFVTARSILEETNNKQKNIETLIKSNSEILKTNDEMSFELSNLSAISNQTSIVVKNFIDTVNSNIENINDESAMIEESTASTTEMHASIEAVSKSTEVAFKISEELKTSSKKTFNAIQEMQEIIKKINQNSEGIFEIVSTILNIAEQTDILAINASIEAAHAGEYGKGFSVVADEIRNLAENTSGRTKEISDMLNNIKDIINQAVEKSGHGSIAINDIQNSINSTIQIINEINSASKEQLIGTTENLSAIQHLVKSSSKIMENLNTQKNMNNDLENVAQKINEAMDVIDNIKRKQEVFFNDLSSNFSQFQTFFYNIINELNKLYGEFEKLKLMKQ